MIQRMHLGGSVVVLFAFAITASVMAQGQGFDTDFVKKAASDGMHEVQLGQYAQQNASSAEVKRFAQHVATDHQKANDELKQIAPAAGLSVPAAMLPNHKQAADMLMQKTGKDFDRAYMDHMVKGHEEAVDLFRKASTSAQNPSIKSFAAKTLPTIEEHLREAKRVQQGVSK